MVMENRRRLNVSSQAAATPLQSATHHPLASYALDPAACAGRIRARAPDTAALHRRTAAIEIPIPEPSAQANGERPLVLNAHDGDVEVREAQAL